MNKYTKYLTLFNLLVNKDLLVMHMQPLDSAEFPEELTKQALYGDYSPPKDKKYIGTLQHRILMARQLFIDLERCYTSIYMNPEDIQMFDVSVLPLMADFSIRNRLFEAVSWVTSHEDLMDNTLQIARGYRNLIGEIIATIPTPTSSDALYHLGYRIKEGRLTLVAKPVVTYKITATDITSTLMTDICDALTLKTLFMNLDFPNTAVVDGHSEIRLDKLYQARRLMMNMPVNIVMPNLEAESDIDDFIHTVRPCSLVTPETVRFLTLFVRQYVNVN